MSVYFVRSLAFESDFGPIYVFLFEKVRFLTFWSEKVPKLKRFEQLAGPKMSEKGLLIAYLMPIISQLAWVGFYSRWGAIISISVLDWGCIRI